MTRPAASATALIAAALLSGCATTSAPAVAEKPGQWMDVQRQMALGDLPSSSEAIARLRYAGRGCLLTDPSGNSGYMACMKSRGYVWLEDSPQKVAHDRARREAMDWLVTSGNAIPTIPLAP